MTDAKANPAQPNTKRFEGDYLLFRKRGQGLRRAGGSKDRTYPPRFRHPTFASAEAEAQRLLTEYPESTIVILQEVGRVKLKPAGSIGNPIDPEAGKLRVLAEGERA